MLKILHLGYTPPNARYGNDGSMFEQLREQADVTFLDIVAMKDPKAIDTAVAQAVDAHSFDLIYKNFVKAVPTLCMRPLYAYGIPVVLSTGDCHTRLINNILNERSNHHRYDGFIVNNGSTIPGFKRYLDRDAQYFWVPWAYNPRIHRERGQRPKIDVGIPASNLRIPMRKQLHKWLGKSEHSYKWIHGVSPEKYAIAIEQCRIGVSTCQVDTKSGKSCHYSHGQWIGMTFTKWYEIPMCGTLHIGQRSGDAEALGFVDGHNAVMFDTLDEGKEKIRFYLNDEGSRTQVLEEARRHIEPMTYARRIKDLLSELEGMV